jgi:hypothetical protein
METPLPEKIEAESGTRWVESSLPYKINQLIDRVAELSEVVDMNAMDIALTTYGNARVEEIIKIAEGNIKTICTKGGYAHEHEPFSCQPPKLCTYCQHKEDGLCEVDHGFSNYESVMYNQAITDLIEAIKK